MVELHRNREEWSTKYWSCKKLKWVGEGECGLTMKKYWIVYWNPTKKILKGKKFLK